MEYDVTSEARDLAMEKLPVGMSDEEFNVILYRVQRLEEAGMQPVFAVAVAVSEDADWRLAEHMKHNGATDHVTMEVVL